LCQSVLQRRAQVPGQPRVSIIDLGDALDRRLRHASDHDLAEALILLQKEEASRILLFGGGFKREALIGLCRAELAALGEAR